MKDFFDRVLIVLMIIGTGITVGSIDSMLRKRDVKALRDEILVLEDRQFRWQQKASQGGYYEPLLSLSNMLMDTIVDMHGCIPPHSQTNKTPWNGMGRIHYWGTK